MAFDNAYADARYADAYATLEFHRTYHLAYRDLPGIFQAHAAGPRALDFGCGAGRSTRFLRRLGYEAVGADSSPAMIARARQLDPVGDYRLVRDDDHGPLRDAGFDLVFSGFTFDNVPGRERKVSLFRSLRGLLNPGGLIVNLVSSPEMYTHEWASFSTRDFPGNRGARTGDVVRTVITDIPDSRPVDDVFWPEEAYREVYAASGLEAIEKHAPLARGDEPYEWVSETRVAPWNIYVLRPLDRPGRAGSGPTPQGGAA
jgi:SAM-dependent methyltransferase